MPSTLIFAENVLGCVELLGDGLGVVDAPGVGNGMNGSLLVNLSSSGCSLAGSAAASAAASVLSEYRLPPATSPAAPAEAPDVPASLLASATASARAAPTISAIST